MTIVLPAMIPKLVERVLLHVSYLLRGFCQKIKGSASHDPHVKKEGSAECIVFHKGVLPEGQRFCWS